MATTRLEIPKEILEATGLPPKDLKAELAIQLLKQGRISVVQAKILAGKSDHLDEWLKKKGWAGHIDLDEFISWAAHDLKSPLNAIIGFTKVVLKGIDGPVNDLQVTDLTTSFNASQRLLTLISDLIDMARLNNGDIKFELSEGNLVRVLTDATERWKTQNPARELQVEIDITSPLLMIDSARLRQVVSSLLTYAANHVAENSSVNLRAFDDKKNITIKIESTGEKARDKFEVELAMLGFVCRGLIELHGGQLELGEDSGSGLALSFTLPKK